MLLAGLQCRFTVKLVNNKEGKKRKIVSLSFIKPQAENAQKS